MLKLSQVSAGYGPFIATHELDLQVPEGSIFALIGANGAGKSSTIMAIAGHVEVLTGRIEFDGEDITNLPVKERVRRGLALVPEGRRLFPDLTVTENLMVGGYIHPRTSEAKNREMVFDLFPRLSERVSQLAGNLSGGEQQMLAMGRALMAEPRFLMIDEVSLGLMPKAVDICYEVINRLGDNGITVLVVDQNTTRALDVADQVCVLESGRSVWQGDAQTAKQDSSLIDSYMGQKHDGSGT